MLSASQPALSGQDTEPLSEISRELAWLRISYGFRDFLNGDIAVHQEFSSFPKARPDYLGVKRYPVNLPKAAREL